jgi:nitrogen fixation/metabolism regulation signal transduction histidine kinase
LVAARHLEPVIERVGSAHGVELSLGEVSRSPDVVVETTRLDDFNGLLLSGSRSRTRLVQALARLDGTILALGLGTVGIALLVALLLARGIARPIVLLSEQAREVASGEPKPVQARGGKELVGLTNAFNQAILDLARLRNRLARTERIAARREIARRVAHEIKNPLAPIRTAIETLRRLRARDDPAFDEYFEEASRTVLEEVARISNIVSEFTRFARLPPPNPHPFDVVDTVRSVVNLHRTDGVHLSFDADPKIELNADGDQIKQVVTNLLQNALDASQGQAKPHVSVRLRSNRESVQLTVSDNGPGVAAEFRDKLFEPYNTTKQHGTGLGLAIVQRIIVEHGGDIVYRDAPSGGALFEVSLPIAGPTLLPEAPQSVP